MTWISTTVKSLHIDQPVPVIAVRDLPYGLVNNGRQTLSIYVPNIPANASLVNCAVTKLPKHGSSTNLPRWYVHIHGGAWRDPLLTAASVEAAVAHAFSDPSNPIDAVVSINYTISPFPSHPSLPYDPVQDHHSDRSREAQHPMHLKDVISAFKFLGSLGLADRSYILSGHSCGSCLAFQAALEPPAYYDLGELSSPPVPAALLGLNGLYDLHNLVYGLGESHQHLDKVYKNLIGIAFGEDQNIWKAASPGRFELAQLNDRAKKHELPPLIVLDQSVEDQLVPVNQTDNLEALLKQVTGIKVMRRHLCTGRHAAPWEEGDMLWQSVQDVLHILQEGNSYS